MVRYTDKKIKRIPLVIPVIVMCKKNDRIYFYDPYKGGNGWFKRSQVNIAVHMSGFAFLAVAPWYRTKPG